MGLFGLFKSDSEKIASALKQMEKKQYNKAFNILIDLAYKGNAEAQYYYGLLWLEYYNDPDRGLDYMQKSAAQGYPVAVEWMKKHETPKTATSKKTVEEKDSGRKTSAESPEKKPNAKETADSKANDAGKPSKRRTASPKAADEEAPVKGAAVKKTPAKKTTAAKKPAVSAKKVTQEAAAPQKLKKETAASSVSELAAGGRYDVVITQSSPDKKEMEKYVRIYSNLTTEEAKHVREKLPFTLRTDVIADEAAEIKRSFESIGATIVLQNSLLYEKDAQEHTYHAILTEVGKNRVSVIKRICDFTKLGLSQAKEAIENLPFTVALDLSAEQARKLKQKLEGVGAKITFEKNLVDGDSAKTRNQPDTKDAETWCVILTGIGNNKAAVIQCVRKLLGVGLREAKEAVDELPFTLKEGVFADDAEKIRQALENVGATVALVQHGVDKAVTNKHPSAQSEAHERAHWGQAAEKVNRQIEEPPKKPDDDKKYRKELLQVRPLYQKFSALVKAADIDFSHYRAARNPEPAQEALDCLNSMTAKEQALVWEWLTTDCLFGYGYYRHEALGDIPHADKPFETVRKQLHVMTPEEKKAYDEEVDRLLKLCENGF